MTPESYAAILSEIAATPDTSPGNIAECGACGFRWDDSSSTELTPAPSGRCPNEYNHVPDIFTEQVTTGWGTLLTIYRDNQPVAYVSVYNTGEVLTETE